MLGYTQRRLATALIHTEEVTGSIPVSPRPVQRPVPPSLPLAFTIARFFGLTVDGMFRLGTSTALNSGSVTLSSHSMSGSVKHQAPPGLGIR